MTQCVMDELPGFWANLEETMTDDMDRETAALESEEREAVGENPAETGGATEAGDAPSLRETLKESARMVAGTMKDVREEVEKSPFAAKVRDVLKDAADAVERLPMLELVHKVLLAGIGAAALTQDQAEELVRRLVERGEIAETDGKRMMKDVLERRKQAMRSMHTGMAHRHGSEDLEKRVEETLTRLNIPTKDEIESLSAKITALTRKVEELKRSDLG